jgi:hypothetical protein
MPFGYDLLFVLLVALLQLLQLLDQPQLLCILPCLAVCLLLLLYGLLVVGTDPPCLFCCWKRREHLWTSERGLQAGPHVAGWLVLQVRCSRYLLPVA